jgi:hypothetical protein
VELLAERVARLVGAEPVAREQRTAPRQPRGAVEGGNERFSVLLADGRRVFVKAARDELAAAWLRRECDAYAHLRGTFIPKLGAFDDDPLYPALVLEDLSNAYWEIRWTRDRVARVALVRSALRRLPTPIHLPPRGSGTRRNQSEDTPGNAELTAAAAVCLDAENTCRQHGLDETMLQAAAACERAAILLNTAAHTEQDTPLPF